MSNTMVMKIAMCVALLLLGFVSGWAGGAIVGGSSRNLGDQASPLTLSEVKRIADSEGGVGLLRLRITHQEQMPREVELALLDEIAKYPLDSGIAIASLNAVGHDDSHLRMKYVEYLNSSFDATYLAALRLVARGIPKEKDDEIREMKIRLVAGYLDISPAEITAFLDSQDMYALSKLLIARIDHISATVKTIK